MWTDRQTDMTELIVAVRNFPKTPKNLSRVSNRQIRKAGPEKKTGTSVSILHTVPLSDQRRSSREQPRTFTA